jgi:hypothetical protein
MIPHARADGTSRGFDHNKPTLLHIIDPLDPTNNVTVDPRKFTAANIAQAIGAVGGNIGHGDDESKVNAQSVFKSLGASTPDVAPVSQPLRSAPVRSVMGGPVLDGPVLDALPSEVKMAEAPASSPSPVAGEAAISQLHPLFEAMLQNFLNTKLAGSPPATAQPVLSRPAPVSAASAIPTETPSKATGITCVDGGVKRPSIHVTFNMGKTGGIVTAHYHEIGFGGPSDAPTCVVLVYDTRYDEGQQYTPSDLGSDHPITLTIKHDGKSRSLSVCSVGLMFDLGCLQCVMLIVPQVAQPVDEEPS